MNVPVSRGRLPSKRPATATATSTATSADNTSVAVRSIRLGARFSPARARHQTASASAATMVATDRGPFTRHSVLIAAGVLTCGVRFGLFGTGPWAQMVHAPALAAHEHVEF